MENKRLWPCVRCTEEEYEEQIREKLHKFGFTDVEHSMIETWDLHPILQTGHFTCDIEIIGNYENLDYDDQYLCKNISEFLSAAKAVAIREEMLSSE